MSGRRILIVDNEAVVIRVLRLALERAGFRVDTAANGAQALASLLQSPPDALITDIEMPVMSGEELCARLRLEMPERGFPIFVVTSLTGLEHRSWSRDVPNLHFMEKPVSARKLQAALESYFSAEVTDGRSSIA